MNEALRLDEQFAIVTETERPSIPQRVLKHGDTFAVFDYRGDIAPAANEQGLYHGGTRYLSTFELLLAGRPPLLLSSTISADNTVFAADLTNLDVVRDGKVVVARGLLHLFRTRMLWNGAWVERIRVTNHSLHPIETTVGLRFDADFADIFEVRGTRRARRGQRLDDSPGARYVMAYRGLDGVERRTTVRSIAAPDKVEQGVATWTVALEPHTHAEIEVSIACELGADHSWALRYEDVQARSQLHKGAAGCTVTTSNEAFNRWLRRSSSDIAMLLTDTPHGKYPYAGIPWFSTPFGRDGIITALELLWIAPEVGRGVLTFLAETQATRVSDAQDAQPGKILHETRGGEMAALDEIPFGKYYGSADATPLFVMLADRYYERTGDLALINRLWPHLLAALDWITEYGDRDRDGFVEYARKSDTGLIQQGWKDSFDSVFHADGRLADPPIALCEVQGYVYGAWRGAARLAAARGDESGSREWIERAALLRLQFERAFWCEDLKTYALALDAAKSPCRVRTSNPGHCLFTGIVDAARAPLVADTLLAEASFAGWGVRTVAAGSPRYNPMSYHNGTIWPHDNAIIAAGLARYGLTTAACRILDAMFDLSLAVDLHRLPELICGFHRRGGESPTLYPVACAPQAWAAGAAFLLLAASLGLEIDGPAHRVTFCRGVLPASLDWVRIENLAVGTATVDLLLKRHALDVSVTVLRREGELEILSVK